MTTQRPSWPIYLTSLGYLLTYGIPATPILSVWLGKITHHANLWAAFPLVIAFIIVPLLQTLFPYGIRPLPDDVLNSRGWQIYHRSLLWLSLPLQLGMLYVALHAWNAHLFNFWGALIYLFSVGTFSGMFAIVMAHELIHHPQAFDQALGGMLLSTVGFGTFKVVHLRIHHRHVGTPLDFATAQRGQSLYAFWWQNLISNGPEAIRCERETLGKRGQAWWQSELLLWYGLSLLWLGIAIGLGGWRGGLFWGLQAFIAILKLDWTNYLQHYGLTRKQESKDRYEPVQVHHAWSQNLFIHDLALFNLFRHGDHHAHPQQPYPGLNADAAAPRYPYDLAFMYFLALVPPLFQRIVHPTLDRLATQQIQPQTVPP